MELYAAPDSLAVAVCMTANVARPVNLLTAIVGTSLCVVVGDWPSMDYTCCLPLYHTSVVSYSPDLLSGRHGRDKLQAHTWPIILGSEFQFRHITRPVLAQSSH